MLDVEVTGDILAKIALKSPDKKILDTLRQDNSSTFSPPRKKWFNDRGGSISNKPLINKTIESSEKKSPFKKYCNMP